MKLKNQGKRLGGLLFLSMALAPAAQAHDAKADWYLNINRAMMHVDDGYQKDTYFVDNDSKSSRAGVTGEKCLDGHIKVGGKLELEFQSASSATVTQSNRSTDSNEIKIRQADTWLKGDFGKLSLGHGSMASFTMVASDLSGTDDTIGFVGPWLYAGAIKFHKKNTTVAATGPEVQAVFSPYDEITRHSRVRYDSPVFQGFSLAASVSGSGTSKSATGGANISNKYVTDLALKYSNEFKDIKVKGAVSFVKLSKGTEQRNKKITAASLALLHKCSGLNLAVNHADNKLGTPGAANTAANISKTQKFNRVQLGWIADLNCYGTTNFVVDYAHSKHAVEDDAKGKGYGFGVVQKLKKINTDLYASIRKMKYDKNGASNVKYNNITAAMAGIKIDFGGKLY